jgi:ATP-dependent protease Clp ATPase subunit
MSRSAENSCAFCRAAESQVNAFVSGPDRLRICDACVELVTAVLLEQQSAQESVFRLSQDKSACCDFCSLKNKRVWRMLQQHDHRICSECVELANRIIADQSGQPMSGLNAFALQQRNKKRRIWSFSWGDFMLVARWR